MVRTTRAALRAQESDAAPQVFEDADSANSTAISPEHQPNLNREAEHRPIFGELTGNDIPKPAAEPLTIVVNTMPVKKGKGKKFKGLGKKNKIQLEVDTNGDKIPVAVEVLEDENQSDSSDAADVAAEELRGEGPLSETFQVAMDVDQPKSTPTAAASEASNTLLRNPGQDMIAVQGLPPTTPRFDPFLHREDETRQALEGQQEDSFAGDIIARSPAKGTPNIEEDKEDSFVDAIIARSSTKAVPRIEDSVAEMDALDEAIEQIAETLPLLEERDLESPVLTREAPATVSTLNPERKPALATIVTTKTTAKPVKARPSPASAGLRTDKLSAPRASTVRNPPKPTNRPSILPAKARAVSADTSAQSSNTSKVSPSFSASPANAQPNMNQKRMSKATSTSLSTSKPGFIPAKSLKPPTQSTFTLPGEAIAAKLKAQREERLKREEEAAAAAAAKKTVSRSTTTRTVPRLSVTAPPSVRPRETKTSQARQSLMSAKDERSASGSRSGNKENVAPANSAGRGAGKKRSPPLNAQELFVKKRMSAATNRTSSPKKLASKKDPTEGAETVQAGSAIRRTGTTSAPRVSTIVRKQSIAPTTSDSELAGSKKAPVGKAELVSQKAKGKEVFSRNKLERQEGEKARKEKEEAAKKARLEAAERGRIASREWAERQKKKLGAAAAARKTSTEMVDGGGAVTVGE